MSKRPLRICVPNLCNRRGFGSARLGATRLLQLTRTEPDADERGRGDGGPAEPSATYPLLAAAEFDEELRH
jgi:hypothetical protein